MAALPRTKDTAKSYPFVWDKLLSRSLFCRPWCPRELCLHPCPFPRVPFFGATPAERALEGTWHTALRRQSQLEVTLLEEKCSFWIEHFFFLIVVQRELQSCENKTAGNFTLVTSARA